jgi:hypothetical protein
VPLAALSGGQRALFLAALAGALLEGAKEPVERRVLLVEAGEVDDATMPKLLALLDGLSVGHVVVARHATAPFQYGSDDFQTVWCGPIPAEEARA